MRKGEQSDPGKGRESAKRQTSTAKESPLNPKQQAFVNEYLVDLNASQAAARAGYSAKTAGQIGYELLKKPEIQEAIQQRRVQLQDATSITPESVLMRWWEIANADASELTAIHYRCCRHCYGEGHAYQWTDEAEYERAVDNAEREDMEPPTDEGGYGFDPRLSPHAKCPKCFGEGHVHVHLADTRKLSPAGRLLFDGVKETKFGIEIKVQDRSKALENVAKHLGMFKTDVNLGVQPDSPLASLFAQLAGKTLKPGMKDD